MKDVTPILPKPVLISLDDAKEFINVDFDDFDNIIEMLIEASISEAERVTGLHIYPVDITENGDTREEGFKTSGELPFDLRLAILQLVATGFAYRNDGTAEAVNQITNASIYKLRNFIKNPMI